jgi:hypothetical protein
MGKPVWILLATSPDWRWLLNRSDTAWYPSVRLFRQTVPRQWSDVFKAVAATLAKEVSGEAVLPPAKLPETPVRPETGTAGASGRAVQRKPRRRPAEPAADA